MGLAAGGAIRRGTVEQPWAPRQDNVPDTPREAIALAVCICSKVPSWFPVLAVFGFPCFLSLQDNSWLS